MAGGTKVRRSWWVASSTPWYNTPQQTLCSHSLYGLQGRPHHRLVGPAPDATPVHDIVKDTDTNGPVIKYWEGGCKWENRGSKHFAYPPLQDKVKLYVPRNNKNYLKTCCAPQPYKTISAPTFVVSPPPRN